MTSSIWFADNDPCWNRCRDAAGDLFGGVEKSFSPLFFYPATTAKSLCLGYGNANLICSWQGGQILIIFRCWQMQGRFSFPCLYSTVSSISSMDFEDDGLVQYFEFWLCDGLL